MSGTLPLWTGIMKKYFPFTPTLSSSASVESDFNDLKHRVFAHKNLPLRVDEFLFGHIVSIIGTMNIAAAALSKNDDEKQKYDYVPKSDITERPDLKQKERPKPNNTKQTVIGINGETISGNHKIKINVTDEDKAKSFLVAASVHFYRHVTSHELVTVRNISTYEPWIQSVRYHQQI
ncbi:hypothetical protein FQA39_LY04526 [Lamprigera yunnana]|nr:hypothetical protein FQA39_LY04526 [Lamprigera yunnana]